MEYILESLNQCILCESKQIRVFDQAKYLSQCSTCGLIFDNPRPTVNTIASFYSEDGKYNAWINTENQLDSQYLRILQRVRRYKKSGALLEVGAGIGQLLYHAKKYYTITGTEISTEGIRQANKRYDVQLLQGEVEQIDLPRNYFDVIVMHQVLEHVPYPGRTLKHCFNLLNKSGILYISIPNESLYSFRILIPRILASLKFPKYQAFRGNGFNKIDFDKAQEIHLSHFSEHSLKTFFTMQNIRCLNYGIDFLDPFQFGNFAFQSIRYSLFAMAHIVKIVTGKGMYNCSWYLLKR